MGTIAVTFWQGILTFCHYVVNIWEILAARFGMYRHRLLQVNVHLTAFFEICDMIQLKFQQLENVGRFCKRFANFAGM